MLRLSLVASLVAAALSSTGNAAHAVTTSALSTFSFAGQCSDCAGTATGSLVLHDYTFGDQIGDMNFVSFTYGGTNLFDPYTVMAADNPFLYGMIDATLPGAETVNISTDLIQFTSSSDGYWCTGVNFSCSFDFGLTHQWSAAAGSISAVPEPMTLSLLGGGLLSLAALRRRA